MFNEEMFECSALLSLEFLDFRGFLLIFDDKCVQEARASELELGGDVVGVLLDLDALGILPSGLQGEVLKNHNLRFYDEQNNLKLALKRTLNKI
jgi:hypothetical protein